jgi:putative transposase
VTLAGFIAAQRAQHRVPYATSCRALGFSPAWFYKWCDGDPSPQHARRAQLAIEIERLFAARHAKCGSRRITAELREAGWRVSKKTVAAIMRAASGGPREEAPQAHHSAGQRRWRAPDLVGRDFPAKQLNQKWYGDGIEIVTDEGKLHLASVLDGLPTHRRLRALRAPQRRARHTALAMAVALPAPTAWCRPRRRQGQALRVACGQP